MEHLPGCVSSIDFLFNQTIIEIDTHIKLIEYNNRKKNIIQWCAY
jgi:hypothetical protein